MLWVWISVMSPHRLAYGFAYDFPFAQIIAIATLAGLLFSTGPKRFPVTPVTIVLFLWVVWMNVTMVFAFDFESSLPMWEKVMKIQFMTFVALFILHSRQHIFALICVVAGSVAFFGIKGGVFTIVGGGTNLVYGPPNSFMEENNSLALATIMIIPLLHYLRSQFQKPWVRMGFVVSMVLCGLSALGSHSRGGLLAIIAMTGSLWMKTRGKLVTGMLLLALVPAAISFMPERWMKRMETIDDYEQDKSSMGRINAWTMAFNLANDRPLVGGGFEIYNQGIFARYAPDPLDVHSAHSIYFQMLGEHGYVGLGLFLLLWYLVWRDASWIIRETKNRSDWAWASDLARMIHVSIIGFAVGGAFLNLGYFDVPYYLLAAIVLTRRLLEEENRKAFADGSSGNVAMGARLS
jgi:probable O-glycosylation ligase (exosortase A-associated)